MQYKEKLQSKIISIALGTVYFIFGVLKFFPNFSPAEDVAKNTIQILTLHVLPPHFGLIFLAIIETFIGLSLLLNVKNKFIIYTAIVHILMTFSPLLLMQEEVFGENQFKVTLLSQYIFKNIIILGALYNLKLEADLIQNKGNNKKRDFLNLQIRKM